MKARVIITLDIPEGFKAVDPWTEKQSLDDFISHWLTEGYFINDYTVDLPKGIEYKGYKIEYPKGWK